MIESTYLGIILNKVHRYCPSLLLLMFKVCNLAKPFQKVSNKNVPDDEGTLLLTLQSLFIVAHKLVHINTYNSAGNIMSN